MIDPKEADYPTIHGLRGAGILIRRFRNQMEMAAAGQVRLRVIEKR
jgi:hypothetical protein